LAQRANVPSDAAGGGEPRGAIGAARLSAPVRDAIRTSVREAEFLEALARLVGAVRMHHQTRPDSDRATK